MATPAPASFADLLEHAVNEPGIISSAYRAFHNYSIGNQLLAWAQCIERGHSARPDGHVPRWKELGRYVRKGEKAITLCRPVTVKRTTTDRRRDRTRRSAATWFVYRPNWFVLAQTDGQPLPEPADADVGPGPGAGSARRHRESPSMRSTATVWASPVDGRSPSIPVNPMPHKTRFHELAHVLLGHTAEGDAERWRADAAQSARSARPKPLRCCAARRWICPASSARAATSKRWWGAGQSDPRAVGTAHPEGGRSDPQGRDRTAATEALRMRAAIYARVSTSIRNRRTSSGTAALLSRREAGRHSSIVDRGVTRREGRAPGPRCAADGRQAATVRCAGVLAAGSARAQPAASGHAAGGPASTRRGVRQSWARASTARRPPASCSCTSWRRSRSSSGSASEKRVLAGLQRARAQGKRLGRPRNHRATMDVPGGSVRAAAKSWGVSKSTAARWIAVGRTPEQPRPP